MTYSIAIAFKDGYGEIGCSINFFTSGNEQSISKKVLNEVDVFLAGLPDWYDNYDSLTTGFVTFQFLAFLLEDYKDWEDITISIEKDNSTDCPDGGCHIYDVISGEEHLTVSQ